MCVIIIYLVLTTDCTCVEKYTGVISATAVHYRRSIHIHIYGYVCHAGFYHYVETKCPSLSHQSPQVDCHYFVGLAKGLASLHASAESLGSH